MNYKTAAFIVGPTASGKSNLALRVARKLSAAIVNADSLQVFKGLDIGTAKPDDMDKKSCPHFLFDLVSPGGQFTAGDYRNEALNLIEREATNKHLLFVGGSGFYFRALEKGMYDIPEVPSRLSLEVRAESHENLQQLFNELSEFDPSYAEKVGPNDTYRIIRAVSVKRAHHLKMSELILAHENNSYQFPLSLVKVGIFWERQILRQRLQVRTEKMLESGFVTEVERMRIEVGSDWSPLHSVGYKEVSLYLDGKIDRGELIEKIVTSSMQLAKRQMTWFRKDKSIHWFNGDNEMEKALFFLESQLIIGAS